MSLILDALRKIELERKAKRQSSQELRNDVLNYHGAAPATDKSWIIPALAAVLLFFASVAGFFYFKNSKPSAIVTTHPKEIVQSAPALATPPQPLQPSPAAPPLQKNLPAEVKISPQPVTQAAEAISIQPKSSEKISVSGIAWQDERSLRRAVINGQLVGEGSEIEGAKIIEIKESRVRFSRGRDVFEIGHSSGAVKP